MLYHKVTKHKYLTSVPTSHVSIVLFLGLIGSLASMSTMCQCTPIPTSPPPCLETRLVLMVILLTLFPDLHFSLCYLQFRLQVTKAVVEAWGRC